MSEKLLTGEEVCELLRLKSVITLRRLRNEEGLPFVEVGRKFLYRRDAIQQWIQDRERKKRVPSRGGSGERGAP